MSPFEVSRRVKQLLIGFAAGLLVWFVESWTCSTAYGGPFTVILSIFWELFWIATAVMAAWLVGLLLLIIGIREGWERKGDWSSLLLWPVENWFISKDGGDALRRVTNGHAVLVAWAKRASAADLSVT